MPSIMLQVQAVRALTLVQWLEPEWLHYSVRCPCYACVDMFWMGWGDSVLLGWGEGEMGGVYVLQVQSRDWAAYCVALSRHRQAS